MDDMRHQQNKWYDRFGIKWIIVLLLFFIAVGLIQQLLFSSVSAAATAESPGETTADTSHGKGVVAVAGQISRDMYGLYLIDLKNGTICVYGMTGSGQLKLLAARTFIYDCQLDSYNTTPLPKEIAKLVARARRLKTVPVKP